MRARVRYASAGTPPGRLPDRVNRPAPRTRSGKRSVNVAHSALVTRGPSSLYAVTAASRTLNALTVLRLPLAHRTNRGGKAQASRGAAISSPTTPPANPLTGP